MDCRNTPGIQQIDAIGISGSEVGIKEVKPEVADIAFYSKLEKLSDNINSENEELSPLISPDGKTLYVCRDGYPETFGGQEIWFSKLDEKGVWGKLERMERPLNNSSNNFVNLLKPYFAKKER